MLEKDIKKILISQDEITAAAKKLGAQLTKDYEGKNPILVGILKGSIPFMAELVKYIDTHLEMDFMMVSSYHGGTVSSGVINIKQDVTQDIKGRHVVFVEDIIDGILKSIKYLENHKNVYEILNLGESEVVTLEEMLSSIEACVEKKAVRKNLPMQPGDVNKTNADITKAQAMIGYNPTTKFQNGIKKFVEWFLSKK